MTSARRRWTLSVSRVLGVWPWLALFLLVLCGLYTRASFGRWPLVYRDSSTDPLVDVTVSIAFLSIVSTAVVIPLAVAVVVVRRIAEIRPTFDKRVASAFIGAVILYLGVWLDPYRYVTWLLD